MLPQAPRPMDRAGRTLRHDGRPAGVWGVHGHEPTRSRADRLEPKGKREKGTAPLSSAASRGCGGEAGTPRSRVRV